MKKLLAIVVAILLPSLAMAQSFFAQSTPAQHCDEGKSCMASVDLSGYVRVRADTPLPITGVGNSAIPSNVQDYYSALYLAAPPLSAFGASQASTGLVSLSAEPGFVTSDTAETGSSALSIKATGHSARGGDVIKFTGGTAANLGVWSVVCTTSDADHIEPCGRLPTNPANGDAFNIYRLAPGGAEMTPAAMVTILPTAVPTAFGTPQFANTTPLRTFTVDNSTGDVEIWCAVGGLTAASFRVPAGSTYTDNLGARGNVMSGAVGCIHPANTPSAGTIAIYGSR